MHHTQAYNIAKTCSKQAGGSGHAADRYRRISSQGLLLLPLTVPCRRACIVCWLVAEALRVQCPRGVKHTRAAKTTTVAGPAFLAARMLCILVAMHQSQKEAPLKHTLLTLLLVVLKPSGHSKAGEVLKPQCAECLADEGFEDGRGPSRMHIYII